MVQKRVSGNDSANISEEFYSNGFQTIDGNTATNYFYTFDHLGSVREVVANDGTTIEGRYNYGVWGDATYMDYSGGNVSQPDFGYAGYFQSKYVPGLSFTENRLYDPGTRQWLSRDPLGMIEGPNLYAYVKNDPMDNADPSGLLSAKCKAALDNLERQFAELVTQVIKYNPATDAIGGFISPKTGQPTVPGGHGEQIDIRIRAVQRAMRRVAQDCKDDFCKPSGPQGAPAPAASPLRQPSPTPIPFVPTPSPVPMPVIPTTEITPEPVMPEPFLEPIFP
jgi:RHS repeat-associated protein